MPKVPVGGVTVPSSGTTGFPPNPQIASDALNYKGKTYVYGGGSPDTGWDCSGFVNWVLGHDFGMVLPGNTKPGFDGKSHGPPVVGYATWTRAVKIPRSQLAAGDLCIWVGIGPNGHIGIATSNTHMVSALNPALGTIETPINGEGPPGAPLIYKRIKNVGSATSNPVANVASGCLPGTGMVLLCLSLLRSLSLKLRSQ